MGQGEEDVAGHEGVEEGGGPGAEGPPALDGTAVVLAVHFDWGSGEEFVLPARRRSENQG